MAPPGPAGEDPAAVAEAWARKAAEQARQRRLSEAVASYDAALALIPGRSAWWHLRGSALMGLRRFNAALASFEHSLRLDPAQPATLSARGVALESLGRVSEAVDCYRRALELAPHYATAHSNLGRLKRESGDLAGAIDSLRTAVALRPDFAMAHNNLGCAFYDVGELQAAIASYRRALALAPDLAECEFALALALLKGGEFAAGWTAFEARLRTTLSAPLTAPAGLRRWRGESLSGRSLVVVAEGGYGDIIHFSRYGALLNACGIPPTLQADSRLAAVLRTSGYFIDIRPPGSDYDSQTHAWYPLQSLPLHFRTEADSIPYHGPYLHADPRRVQLWRERLHGIEGLRVGIVWQGRAGAEVGSLRGRSMPAGELEPLAQLPGVTLISLQHGGAAAQLAALPSAARIRDWTREMDIGPDAFVDTAALIVNLDLVISVDTSTAHLAGALGAPVWLALHFASDWRWLQTRTDTPWYPTMRLFRQPQPGDWPSVITQMCRELQVRQRSPRVLPSIPAIFPDGSE